MKTLIFALAIGLMAVGLVGCEQAPLPNEMTVQEEGWNWTKFHKGAKDGKTVRLKLEEVSTSDGSNVDLLLKDGDKEHWIASMAFYVDNNTSVLFDLSHTLKGLEKAPSTETVLLLKGTEVMLKSAKIEVVD